MSPRVVVTVAKPMFSLLLFRILITITSTVVYYTRLYTVDYVYSSMYGHTYSKSMDQPGKVANPARVQLNRENNHFPVRARA